MCPAGCLLQACDSTGIRLGQQSTASRPGGLLLGKKQPIQNASAQVPAVHKHAAAKLLEQVDVAVSCSKQLQRCSCRTQERFYSTAKTTEATCSNS
jgi:hypothetical protein